MCQTLNDKSVSASPLAHMRATSPEAMDQNTASRKQGAPDIEKGAIPNQAAPPPMRSNTQDRREAAEDRINQAKKENELLKQQDNQLTVHVSTKVGHTGFLILSDNSDIPSNLIFHAPLRHRLHVAAVQLWMVLELVRVSLTRRNSNFCPPSRPRLW